MNYFRCGGGRSTHTATKIDVAKTPLATFESNVSGLYLPEILAYIQATQSGTGDPSPSNPRAISGVSEVDTTVCGIAINYPATATYEPYTGTTATTALGGTYYGGYLNVTTGLLTVTDVRKDLGDIDWNAFDTTNKFIYTWNTLTPAAKPTANNNIAANMLCEIYPTLSRSEIKYSAPFKTGIAIDQTGNIIISDQNNTWSNINEAKAELTGHYVVYELATPQTVQLTPAQIEQLLGQNNVFCSSGDVAVKYWKID